MGLFQLGDHTLHSGKRSKILIDCNALTDGDLEMLAWVIYRKVRPFGSVEGIPWGGLRLAAAVEKYATPLTADLHVFVDDVWTTGGSMREAFARDKHGMKTGYVIFARDEIPAGSGVRAIFPMDPVLEFPGDFTTKGGS